MKIEDWPAEVIDAYNPPFCCIITMKFVKAYEDAAKRAPELPLGYLASALVFVRRVRESLPRAVSTPIHSWVRENSEVALRGGAGASIFKDFVDAGIIWGANQGVLRVEESWKLYATEKGLKSNPESSRRYQGVRGMFRKSRFLGRWFATVQHVPTIAGLFGVRV